LILIYRQKTTGIRFPGPPLRTYGSELSSHKNIELTVRSFVFPYFVCNITQKLHIHGGVDFRSQCTSIIQNHLVTPQRTESYDISLPDAQPTSFVDPVKTNFHLLRHATTSRHDTLSSPCILV